jgi:phage terminase large subunit
MADRRLAALAKQVAALRVESGGAVVVGPVIDADTNEVLLPGKEGGRKIRVAFVGRGLHVDEGGVLISTAEAWRRIGVEPVWEEGGEETAAEEAGRRVDADVVLPEYVRPLFRRSTHQFAALLGGRGGAKSTAVGIVLLLLARAEPIRVVCARQFQSSVAASVKALLDDWIAKLGLVDEFRSTEVSIEHRATGSGFLFIGLDRNPASVKSLEGCDIAWVEEAHTLVRRSLDILVPTVRRPGSALWFTLNPEMVDDPVDEYFRGEEGPPPGAYIAEVNYDANPWFFTTSLPLVLARDMTGQDRNRAEHIWLGAHAHLAEAAILPGVEVGEVASAGWTEVLGLDFSGGGDDPHALIRARVDVESRTIHVVAEHYGHEALEDLPAVISGAVRPGETVWADGSRPDVIDHLRRHDHYVDAAPKGPGSVMTGIYWLRGFRIVVSRNCPRFYDEARRYSWKIDRRTGRILPVPVDRDNHGIDALRYGCSDLIEGRGGGGAVYIWSGGRKHVSTGGRG